MVIQTEDITGACAVEVGETLQERTGVLKLKMLQPHAGTQSWHVHDSEQHAALSS